MPDLKVPTPKPAPGTAETGIYTDREGAMSAAIGTATTDPNNSFCYAFADPVGRRDNVKLNKDVSDALPKHSFTPLSAWAAATPAFEEES